MEDDQFARVPPAPLTVKSSVKELTPDEVAESASDALATWLPGYTEYDETTDSQWRITDLGENRFRFEQAYSKDRVFRIDISVVEEK